jgi:phage-related protein
MAEAVSGPTGPTPPVPNRLVVPLQEGGQQQAQGPSNLDSIVASVMGVLEKKKVGNDEALRSQIDDVLDYTSGKKKGKFAEDDEKNRKGWRKWLYGGWQAAGKALGAIERGVKKLASNGLMSFLVGLALLSMFDPDGTFIVSLIEMMTNLFLMLINIFISLIPKMINFLMVAVPKIAKALGEAFMKVLSAMFKSLGESNSFLEFVLKLVFFGAIIAKIVMSLSFLFPILAAVMTPVGIIALLIVGAFLGLAYSFQQAYKKSQAVRDAVSSVFEMLKDKVKSLWEKIKGLWDRITGAFTRIKEALFGKDEGSKESFWVSVVENVGAVLGAVMDGIAWAIDNVLGPVIDILGSIIVIFIKIFKFLMPVFKAIGQVVWGILKPAFQVIGEIFSGIAKFFKDLSEASSWSDAANIIGKAFYDAGVWLKDKLFGIFEVLINKILRLLPKQLGGFSSGQVSAQEEIGKSLEKSLGLGGADKDTAVDLLELLKTAKDQKVDFSKLKKDEDYARVFESDFRDTVRRAGSNQAAKDLYKQFVAELSTREFKDFKDEGQEQLAEVFKAVGSDLEKALKNKGKVSQETWKKLDSIVPKRKVEQ